MKSSGVAAGSRRAHQARACVLALFVVCVLAGLASAWTSRAWAEANAVCAQYACEEGLSGVFPNLDPVAPSNGSDEPSSFASASASGPADSGSGTSSTTEPVVIGEQSPGADATDSRTAASATASASASAPSSSNPPEQGPMLPAASAPVERLPAELKSGDAWEAPPIPQRGAPDIFGHEWFQCMKGSSFRVDPHCGLEVPERYMCAVFYDTAYGTVRGCFVETMHDEGVWQCASEDLYLYDEYGDRITTVNHCLDRRVQECSPDKCGLRHVPEDWQCREEIWNFGELYSGEQQTVRRCVNPRFGYYMQNPYKRCESPALIGALHDEQGKRIDEIPCSSGGSDGGLGEWAGFGADGAEETLGGEKPSADAEDRPESPPPAVGGGSIGAATNQGGTDAREVVAEGRWTGEVRERFSSLLTFLSGWVADAAGWDGRYRRESGTYAVATPTKFAPGAPPGIPRNAAGGDGQTAGLPAAYVHAMGGAEGGGTAVVAARGGIRPEALNDGTSGDRFGDVSRRTGGANHSAAAGVASVSAPDSGDAGEAANGPATGNAPPGSFPREGPSEEEPFALIEGVRGGRAVGPAHEPVPAGAGRTLVPLIGLGAIGGAFALRRRFMG